MVIVFQDGLGRKRTDDFPAIQAFICCVECVAGHDRTVLDGRKLRNGFLRKRLADLIGDIGIKNGIILIDKENIHSGQLLRNLEDFL